MWARGLTFFIWAALAASAVFWGLRLLATGTAAPAHAKPVSAATPAPALQAVDLSRVLGAEPVAVVAATPQAAPADARFQLLGVVASRVAASSRQAVALIAVDGKPARAYRVGAVVSGDTVLRAVHAKGADLGPSKGPVQVSLQLMAGTGAGVVVGAAAAAPGATSPSGPPTPPLPTSRGAPVRPPFSALPGSLAPPSTGAGATPGAGNTAPPTAMGRLVRAPQVMPVPQPGAAATMQNLQPPMEGDASGEPPQRRRPGSVDALR